MNDYELPGADPEDDILCPYCGEPECERSCMAVLAAAVGECQECGYPILEEDGPACPACGEVQPVDAPETSGEEQP